MSERVSREEVEELLLRARTMIRDMAHGWPEKQLLESPCATCEDITLFLGDAYDFDTGIES